ncbi:MAG TPA: hypothetical protein VFZ83_02950 [Acidimicrobiia bacterium]|nr:hypothetical protein [Acidimicrobiia bacterium]
MPPADPAERSPVSARFRRVAAREALYAIVVAALAASANLLAFLDRNRADIDEPGRVVRWAVVAAIAAAACVVVGIVALPRVAAPAVGAVVASAAFLLLCWSWFDVGPLAVQYTLWIAGTAAVAALARLAMRTANGRVFVLVLVGALAALPAVSFVRWDATARAAASDEPVMRPTPLRPPVRPDLPSIFVFVLDGYGRADQLRRVTGYDNAPMDDALARRGFTVDERAFSPYPVTWLSIASLLDMDHVAHTSADVAAGRSRFVDRLRGNNAFVRTVRALGYGYVHAESGTYDGSRCTELVDVCIPARTDDAGVALDELEFASLQLTPLRPLLDRGTLPLADTATAPGRVVDALPAARAELGEHPLAVFAHVVSPHAPYRYEADCTHRRRNVAGLGTGWDDDLTDEYTEQLQCLNRQLLDAIDRIVADDPDAIIVLTGDHGPAFTVDFTAPLAEWSDDQRAERFAVFHASRLPDRCRPAVPQSGSLVDALRVVTACVAGTEPTPVDPRAFLYRYDHDTLEELDDLSPLTE